MEPMFSSRIKLERCVCLSRCQKNWETTCAIEHVVTSKLSLSSRRALWVVRLFITTVAIGVLVAAEILPDVDTCLIKLC